VILGLQLGAGFAVHSITDGRGRLHAIGKAKKAPGATARDIRRRIRLAK